MHFKVCSRYFYSKLDNTGKRVYEQLLDGWLNYNQEITISGYTDKNMYDDIIHYIHADNPELFYIDFNHISLTFTSRYTVVHVNLRYSVSQCERIKQEIAGVVSGVMGLCRRSADPQRVIHDYLVENVQYASGFRGEDIYNIKGALIDGAAVCEGYSRAFKLLCDAAGIPCIVVTGTATNSNGRAESHAWNIVSRNNRNYHVDVTWDGCLDSTSGIPLYYNVPDAFISKNHVWDKRMWPACTDASELDKQIIPVSGRNGLRDVLVRMSQRGESVFAVRLNQRYASINALMDTINGIVSTASIDISSFSVSYQPLIDCAIIWFNY